MSRSKTMLLLLSAVALTGCALDPRDYETPPVAVETTKGRVVCQLYTPDRVVWDRAIERPKNMSVEEADNICRAEGARQKNG